MIIMVTMDLKELPKPILEKSKPPPLSLDACRSYSLSIPTLTVPLSDIEEFVETTIVLRKDRKNELGVSVVGGNDTYLEAICVSEVHPDGVAFKDGRLKRGDILLAVNDITLRDLANVEAVKVLREASSPLRLVVLRENPQIMFTFDEGPTRILTVELKKANVTDRLGLSIMQRHSSSKENKKNLCTNVETHLGGEGVFITWVQPGSISARNGRILQGDQILEINGQNVRSSTQEEVAQTIRNLDGALVLLLGRIPSLTQSIQEWARRKVGSPGRIRTSTWSYTGSKEKLQSQRPSLPTTTGKEKFLGVPGLFKLFSSDGRSRKSGDFSPRKGIVEGLRLTLTPENTMPPIVITIDEENPLVAITTPSVTEKSPVVPSIEVTSC